MITFISSIVAAACVGIYWVTVAVKCIRISRVIRKDPNVIPRERTGQVMRLVWAPVLGAWLFYPWFHIPGFTNASIGWLVTGVLGAAVCVFALAASYHCWREMGTSWRIGIDPNEKTAMVVSGAYRRVRHPIYALSILLVLGSLAANPSIVMLVVASFHSTLMVVEAVREEKHMLSTHGQAYADYMKTTGRFIPRC